MEFLVVGLGGFCGAITRYLVYLGEQSTRTHSFPLGTLFINVLGCFFAGILSAAVERALPLHRYFILLSSMGFLGSFTTFSTFSIESFQLLRSSHFVEAVANLGANIFLGIGSIWIGRFLLFSLY